MICGEPGSGDCEVVLREFYAHLDNEPTTMTIAEIRRHLDECAPCLHEADYEAAMKRLVHRCCGCEPAPVELRVRIMTAITRVQF